MGLRGPHEFISSTLNFYQYQLFHSLHSLCISMSAIAARSLYPRCAAGQLTTQCARRPFSTLILCAAVQLTNQCAHVVGVPHRNRTRVAVMKYKSLLLNQLLSPDSLIKIIYYLQNSAKNVLQPEPELLTCGNIYISAIRNSNPDTANDRGQTALMLASACGNLSCVRLLISKGASIDRADELDRQALHYAASCSQNTVVDALLEAGADANARDTTGMTPTLEACSSAHELTLLSLLEKGGDPLHKNKRGEDGRALAHDCPKILQIIQQSQSSSKQPHTLDELLEALQLSRLAPKFVRENVDLALFFELNEKDFDDMEIPYGPKKKMLTVIERFKKTGSVSTDAFETPALQAPTAGFAPRQSQSDDQSTALRDMQVSIQIVKENNDDIKQLALEALEKLSQSSSAPQLRHLLTSIIDNSENIAARISRHK